MKLFVVAIMVAAALCSSTSVVVQAQIHFAGCTGPEGEGQRVLHLPSRPASLPNQQSNVAHGRHAATFVFTPNIKPGAAAGQGAESSGGEAAANLLQGVKITARAQESSGISLRVEGHKIIGSVSDAAEEYHILVKAVQQATNFVAKLKLTVKLLPRPSKPTVSNCQQPWAISAGFTKRDMAMMRTGPLMSLCNKLDICFGTCGSTHKGCADTFNAEAAKACTHFVNAGDKCRLSTQAFFGIAMQEAGQQAFEEAQRTCWDPRWATNPLPNPDMMISCLDRAAKPKRKRQHGAKSEASEASSQSLNPPQLQPSPLS